ncbi:MAG: 30S ribosomal protein S5 [Methanobacteriota archaeon]|nr:MAG: 30S ribosomal protein S5 [Euryarchaeota archaeon]|tara:strand:+ start:9875 stop:10672 length:798 start_codon:yes stop_codon:yes gene_type:complete
MTEEEISVKEDIDQFDSEEKPLAPGLRAAVNFETTGDSPRRRGETDEAGKRLREWAPKTRLGKMVSNGEILTMEKAISTGLPIMEVEIIDALIPNLEDDVLCVNMVQRMTDSGRRVRFNVLAAVGNKDGYVGIGMAKGKEVPATIQKAITVAKLNIIPVLRGNGSWESGVGPGTSIPIEVTGRSSSTRLTLIPAPSGKGLVVGPVGKRVLTLAGITDIWSRSKGQTRTTINYAKATFNALIELNKSRISTEQRDNLFIVEGRVLE